MKIIEGSLAGVVVNYKEQKGTRVTSDKVRKAVFDVLKGLVNFEGIHVADIFCGSGMYGIEAASRGADTITFVDESKGVVQKLKENINKILKDIKDIRYLILNIGYDKFIVHYGFTQPARNATHNVAGGEHRTNGYDLVFADPPYYDFDFGKFNNIYSILNKDGVFVLESSKRVKIGELENLKLILEKKYGDTIVRFYKNIS